VTALLFRFVLPVALLVLWVYALVDAIKVPDDSMYQAGNKLIWILVILLAPVIGSIVYLVVGRPIRERPSRRPRQIPPDDII
jgi:hypothetical protein